MNLVSLLEERARECPEVLALVESRGRRRRALTFAQLAERVGETAGAFRRAGLGAGDAVLFLHPVGIELYVNLLAAMRIGAVPMLVDPGAGLSGLRRALQRVEPVAWTGHGRGRWAACLLPELWRRTRLRTDREDRSEAREEFGSSAAADLGDDAPALITFTSGSTGLPKAAVRCHGFLLAQNRVLGRSISLVPGEVDLVTLPVFALANLAHGVTSVLAETSSAAVTEQVRSESVTRCAAAPARFRDWIEAGVSFRGMSKLFTGGGPVFPEILEKLKEAAPGARVAAVYGSTEAEPIAHAEAECFAGEDLEAMRQGKGLLAGSPVEEIRVAILPDRWGRPIERMDETFFEKECCPAGTPGEIVVSGAHVLGGYLGGVGDEETKFRVGETIWHRTGDAGWLDERGRLWLLGRCGAVLRDERGELHPLAVETALSFVPDLGRCAVVAHRGKRWLVTEGGESVDDALLAANGLDEQFPMARIPMDRRHRSKIDYPALARRLERTPGN